MQKKDFLGKIFTEKADDPFSQVGFMDTYTLPCSISIKIVVKTKKIDVKHRARSISKNLNRN